MKEGKDAVFPCVLKQVATFRKSDPIVLGVDVESGVIRIGTPLIVYREGEVFLDLFRKVINKFALDMSNRLSTITKN